MKGMSDRRQKRKHGGATGNTPGKPSNKTSRSGSSSRKTLFSNAPEQDTPKSSEWSREELIGLIQYIALFSEDHSWPTHKKECFWNACAASVSQYSGQPLRSGLACRTKILKVLKPKYATVEEAEAAFNINYFDDMAQPFQGNVKNADSPLPGELFSYVLEHFVKLTAVQRMQLASSLLQLIIQKDFSEDMSHFVPSDFLSLLFLSMEILFKKERENTIYHLCKAIAERRLDIDRMPFGLISYNCKFFACDDASNLSASEDYKKWMESMYCYFGNAWASLFLGPMWSYETVEDSTVSNVQNEIVTQAMVNAFGQLSIPDCSETSVGTNGINMSLSDIHSMASGDNPASVVHSVTSGDNISSSDGMVSGDNNTVSVVRSSSSGVGCQRLSTLWSVLSSSELQEMAEAEVDHRDIAVLHNVTPQSRPHRSFKRSTSDAKVNVAGPSARTIRRHIEDSGFKRDTGIQLQALKKLKEAYPNGRWYIKADATDMKAGLRESMRGEWSGDCDLGDGKLQQMKAEYEERIRKARGIGLKERNVKEIIFADIQQQINEISEEKKFLETGLKKAKDLYRSKQKQHNVGEQNLFALAWDVDGFEKLIKMQADILSSMRAIQQLLHAPVRGDNIPRKLTDMRKDLEEYIKGITSKRREAASHLLVFMISDEQRSSKPYAIPIRALPYKSLTDDAIRQLRDEIRDAMHNLGMLAVGFSTDGEFNSLRTKGNNRPLSVIQLMMDAKSQARSTPCRQIQQFLTPIRGADGNITAAVHHDAIPQKDIEWMYDFMYNGESGPVTFSSAIHILRRTHFPFHYDPHPWLPGSKEETKNECLKSLMATYIYRKMVLDHTNNGVNFKDHLYVPEVDPRTQEYFHEREDHAHVLKRIANCTRAGDVPDVDARAFVDALHDPSTGLTYTALTGQRKQSVPDCERMFSRGVLEYMERNGKTSTARFVRVVHIWHKASDGRGLSEETRRQYNLDMLDYILEDWMPWYQQNRDYSTMDVNRPIKKIKGMTREVIVALVANIESMELRRSECETRGLPPEHPRASATDDLEGFFAVLHHLLGPIFDHKTFLENSPKIVQEFVKKADPDLPFYHWTGINERFHVGPMASFNMPSAEGIERLDQVNLSRRADPGVFLANRATLPQRGSLTVRAQFHSLPEGLPPLVL